MTTGPGRGSTSITRIGVGLFILSGAAAVVAAAAAAGFSIAFHVRGWRVSIRHATNPALAPLLLGLLSSWSLGRHRLTEVARTVHEGLRRAALTLSACAPLLLLAALLEHGAFVAGNSDTSGYVSQARLWQSGTLRRPVPELAPVPLAHGLHARAPLGYRVAAGGRQLVPTYPPGLPLLMAAFEHVFGRGAGFWVVPLSAGVLVFVTFLLGRRVGGPIVGLFAAVGAAVSPTLLFQGVLPMSDVPAAAAWLTAVALLAGGSIPRTAAAALVASLACLIRPNLFAMVPMLVVATLWWTPTRSRRVVHTALVAVPPALLAIAFAWWQRDLYGAVTDTGYGEVGSLFALRHIRPNLQLYPLWLLQSHGFLLLLALPAPLLLGAADTDERPGAGANGAPVARWSVLMCARQPQSLSRCSIREASTTTRHGPCSAGTGSSPLRSITCCRDSPPVDDPCTLPSTIGRCRS